MPLSRKTTLKSRYLLFRRGPTVRGTPRVARGSVKQLSTKIYFVCEQYGARVRRKRTCRSPCVPANFVNMADNIYRLVQYLKHALLPILRAFELSHKFMYFEVKLLRFKIWKTQPYSVGSEMQYILLHCIEKNLKLPLFFVLN